jgi:hypothetical protein
MKGAEKVVRTRRMREARWKKVERRVWKWTIVAENGLREREEEDRGSGRGRGEVKGQKKRGRRDRPRRELLAHLRFVRGGCESTRALCSSRLALWVVTSLSEGPSWAKERGGGAECLADQGSRGEMTSGRKG